MHRMQGMLRGLLVWFLLATGVAASEAGRCVAPAGAAQTAAQLLERINAARAARGLAGYAPSAQLGQAAQVQACDMAVHGYFAHARAGAPGVAQRIKATGYRLRAGNENLAYTRQLAPESVMQIWQQSPPHWAAVLDTGYRDIGVALAQGAGRIYWVMVVAR